jgi:hypothetical protein
LYLSLLYVVRLANSFAFNYKCHSKATWMIKRQLNSCRDLDQNELPHRLIEEKTVYSGWRQIKQRKVVLPDNREATFDILSQGNPSVLVFTWNTKTSTSTLIKEYQPGSNQVLYGTVAGMFESKKHADALQCAKFELEEEAGVASNNWIPLLSNANASIPFDKYSDNRFYVYMALDCVEIGAPREKDENEFIIVEDGFSRIDLMKIISNGQVNVASAFAILLGLNKLKDLGLIVD